MDKEKVKMTVKRDEETIAFELAGGIIGVRVKTELLGSKESDDWGDEESDDWGDEEFDEEEE